jgi:hypothetical protein
MHTSQIIAHIIIEMTKTNLEIGHIRDICDQVYAYKCNGHDIQGITLQRTPLGFHSSEVAEFVGRLVIVGLATQGDPVIITEEGVVWLKRFASQGVG